MAQNTPEQQLFDLLVTRGFEPTRTPVQSTESSEIISFKFISSAGKNYGTVVVMLGDDKNLELFSGDNLGRTMDSKDKTEWYSFQQQLKNFATRNLMTYKGQDISKLKYSMQGQAALSEGLYESWNGTKHVSWNGDPESVRLMIRHKRPMSIDEARYRQIESLFVETAEGERYKLPFRNLAGGRAMVEHVRQGGRPYDLRGAHIANMVEELNVLSRFRRASHGRVFEDGTADLVSRATAYHSGVSRALKGLGSARGYNNYFENWNPGEITEQELIIEDIKTLFVEQTIDSRIEQALPILARLQQQGTAMKEANIFEAWANRLVEGTWAVPDTPEEQQQLVALLSQEFPVGADATNATEQLYSLVGDDELFDQLQDLAAQDAAADCRSLVVARIKELSDNGIDGFDAVLSALKAEQISAPAVPAPPVAESDGSCNYTAEGEHCPEHGLMECGSGMYEDEHVTIGRLRELSGMNNSNQGMAEAAGYDGSEPLDLSTNPSVNDVFKRALYIYDYEGYGNDMDYSEDEAIEQYVARKFGQDVLDKLATAKSQQYFGRADGKGPGGGGRTSNLGTSSAPGGNFRTTKAGVMNKQDAKTMKGKVADRLGRHPAPNLPEGYYDLNDEGMQPIDLTANPSFKDLVNRYTQLFYQGHEGSYDEEESAESDAIEQYVAKRFGQKGSDHLLRAAQASYGGRDDGRGHGGSRSSNLGWPSMPGGDFRTTKAGKMHKQDAGSKKQIIGNRLGSHPTPTLPEGVEDSPVASAITRRILLQRSDLLSKYGPEKVMSAIDEVADFVGDVEEIGSSDVSGWIKHVEQMLGNMAEEVAVTTGNPPLEETVSLKGQYGHSGKLQKFDEVEQDIVARLRELSGMIRPA